MNSICMIFYSIWSVFVGNMRDFFQKSGTNCQTFLIKWSQHTFAIVWLPFILKQGYFWTRISKLNYQE